jgi:hypothetical protein
MTAKIACVRPANNAEWDAIWAGCPYSTFFHSREWAEIWESSTDGKLVPRPKVIAFDDNRSVLLPVCIERQYFGFVEAAYSSPAGTFGGWISLDELSPAQDELLTMYTLTNYPDLTWRTNPYSPGSQRILPTDAIADATQVIDLRSGFDSVFRRWSKGHASAAKKALRSGVTIEVADSEARWREYFDIYLASLRRWDTLASSRYEWRLFRTLFERKSENVKLWLAMYLGRPIAGALCLYSPRHVVYWHGAALEEYFPLRPVNYLLCEAIRDACNRPARWFDFNPSGGHHGVEQFKRSFGTNELPAPIISRISTRARIGAKFFVVARRCHRFLSSPMP